MKSLNLSVKVRNEKGKGPSRRLRMAGAIPAVFYGHKSEAMPLSLQARDLSNILSSETGSRTFLWLSIDGESTSKKMALIKDLQVNPV